jgi:hypothetical protein
MAGRQLSKTLTALAGEFLVAGQLCLRGYVASLTLKNYPGVDIFALNPLTNTQVAIQVKTIRIKGAAVVGDTPRPYPPGHYFIPESVDDHHDRPFVFVAISGETDVEYFVMPGALVASISERERQAYFDWAKETGRTVAEKQPRMLSLKALQPFRDRWDNLRLG